MKAVTKCAAILATLFATPALSCPDGSITLVSCTLKEGAKYLETCLMGDHATYAFGTAERRPDLALARHVDEVEMTPWPGVGREIWEDFTFHNGETSYRVHYSIDRFSEQGDGLSGGVTVLKGQEPLAQLECDAGSINAGYPLPLWDAKEAGSLSR